jgi:hypothetical protein
LVAEVEAVANDGVEKALGFARAGTGGDEGGFTLVDGANSGLLVPVDRGIRDQLFHERVEDALMDQVVYGGPLLEDAAEADVGAFEQGGGAGSL